MKRSLKRSRMLGMLAVLLTMSLVTAFGVPAATADEDQGKREERREECKPRSGSEQGKQSDSKRSNGEECEENGSSKTESKSKSNSEARGSGNSESKSRGDSEGRASSKSKEDSKSKSSSAADNSGNSKSKSKSNSEARDSSKSKDDSKSKSSSEPEKSGNSKSKSKNNSEARGSSNSKDDSKNKSKREARKSGNSQSKSKKSKSSSKARGSGKASDGNGGTHPPGNNGTVKIDGIPFGDHPNNEPHPGCVFEVDFYNYEQGDLTASVTFTAHPPTEPSGEVVLSESGIFIGEDAAMGGTDLDATRTYTLDLSGYTAHDKQGHHIKLTVNAEGSQGADTKHKVFWVDCLEDSVPGDDVADDVVEDGNGAEVDDEVEGIREEVVEEDRSAVQPDLEVDVGPDAVLGTRIEQGAPTPVVVQSAAEVAAQQEEEAEVRSAVLPFTGAALTAFVILALSLIGTGAAFVRRRSMR